MECSVCLRISQTLASKVVGLRLPVTASHFIKIKNITLGYKLPLKKIVQNARVYVTAENLIMWDKYDGGFSPESSNGSSGDYDYGAYPQARVISLGVNVTF